MDKARFNFGSGIGEIVDLDVEVAVLTLMLV